MVVWNVTPALHTADERDQRDSIIILGAIPDQAPEPAVMWIAGVTILLTSISIAGGTRRMLDVPEVEAAHDPR
jgi:hypothetical protein